MSLDQVLELLLDKVNRWLAGRLEPAYNEKRPFAT